MYLNVLRQQEVNLYDPWCVYKPARLKLSHSSSPCRLIYCRAVRCRYMQNRCQHPQEGQTLEFKGEVRLRSEEGKRLKGAPAVFVGESQRAGPAPRRRPGLLLANCAHRLSWHPSSLELWSLREPRQRGNSSRCSALGWSLCSYTHFKQQAHIWPLFVFILFQRNFKELQSVC